MGDVVDFDFANTVEALPTGPSLAPFPARSGPPHPTIIDRCFGVFGVDWDAETVGPLTNGAAAHKEQPAPAGRPASPAIISWPGGQR